jgi:hypothetical protein
VLNWLVDFLLRYYRGMGDIETNPVLMRNTDKRSRQRGRHSRKREHGKMQKDKWGKKGKICAITGEMWSEKSRHAVG